MVDLPFTTDLLQVRAFERYWHSFFDMRAAWATRDAKAALTTANQSRCGLEGPSEPWPR